MFLKIAVLNNSGNVGKSMICDNLFLPRIPNSEVLKIETLNYHTPKGVWIPVVSGICAPLLKSSRLTLSLTGV